MKKKKEENEFNIKLGGKIERIDVNEFASTLLYINDVIQEINKELKTNKKVELTIKAYEAGSFNIYFQLVADAIGIGAVIGLFHGNNLQVTLQIIKIFNDIFKLKGFLKGEEPKRITNIENNRIKIENNSGSIVIIEKVSYEIAARNQEIDMKARKVFKKVEEIPDVDSIEFKDSKGKRTFIAEKKDFPDLIKENKIINIPQQIFKVKTIDKVRLNILKLVFEEDRKWEFLYCGNKIPVIINDENWMKDVLNGQVSFSSGDILEVDLAINQKYNELAKAYENQDYFIVKVHKIINQPKQNGLFSE